MSNWNLWFFLMYLLVEIFFKKRKSNLTTWTKSTQIRFVQFGFDQKKIWTQITPANQLKLIGLESFFHQNLNQPNSITPPTLTIYYFFYFVSFWLHHIYSLCLTLLFVFKFYIDFLGIIQIQQIWENVFIIVQINITFSISNYLWKIRHKSYVKQIKWPEQKIFHIRRKQKFGTGFVKPNQIMSKFTQKIVRIFKIW